MSKYRNFRDDAYYIYGFKRQEIVDYFYSKGKQINLGIPPMKFEDVEDPQSEQLTLDEALSEIERLNNRINELEGLLPKFLSKYREDDPLLLAIQIRNSEWNGYDPDNDRLTRGNQAAIKQSLENRGFTSRQAESIELVACPIKRG